MKFILRRKKHLVFDYLGYQNPEKLCLSIEGNCEHYTGIGMQDGKIIVEGNCGKQTGAHMQGGELNIKGEVESFDKSAFSFFKNKGTIIWKGAKIWEKGWTKEGKKMRKKGEIPVG